MNGHRIALFANHDSRQLLTLRDILVERGEPPLVCDIQLGGPTQPKVFLNDSTAFWNDHDFKTVKAVHIRCTAVNTLPLLPAVMNEISFNERRTDFIREQHHQAVTFGFFDHLTALGKLVVNPLTSAYLDHDSKAQFYEKLRAAGFDTPRTLSTNDPDRARRFIDKFPETVVKPAIGIGSTRVISRQDQQRLDEIRACPVMLQERVFGDTIRVHIVGDTVVLALRILSDGGVDSRTNTRGFEYFAMPEEEQARIVRANRFLGLHYAAWDIIAAPDGRFSYLDCNPGPFIMWIGRQNTHTVLSQLANYLITFAHTESLEAASQAVSACHAESLRR